jgi:hypothetical protein
MRRTRAIADRQTAAASQESRAGLARPHPTPSPGGCGIGHQTTRGGRSWPWCGRTLQPSSFAHRPHASIRAIPSPTCPSPPAARGFLQDRRLRQGASSESASHAQGFMVAISWSYSNLSNSSREPGLAQY